MVLGPGVRKTQGIVSVRIPWVSVSGLEIGKCSGRLCDSVGLQFQAFKTVFLV